MARVQCGCGVRPDAEVLSGMVVDNARHALE